MGAGSRGSPGVPLLPFPPGGPGSYSSPSQTAQPARKALPCQQRPRPWLPAGWAGAAPQPGGWACCAGLASDPRPCSAPAQEGSLKFSSAAPRPPAPALNPACALRSPAAGSPGYVLSLRRGVPGTGTGQSLGCLWCWSPPSSDARPPLAQPPHIHAWTDSPALPCGLAAPLAVPPTHGRLLPCPDFSHPPPGSAAPMPFPK